MKNYFDKIKEKLKKNIKFEELEIVDNSNLHKGHNNFTGNNETHIKIILTKKNKIPINRMNIHRIINNLLEEEFKSGLHSLEIKIN